MNSFTQVFNPILTLTVRDTSIVVFGGTIVVKVAIVMHNELQSTIKESNNLIQHTNELLKLNFYIILPVM